ncbi:SCY kinase (incomplete catalytic triad) [Besnoitia besnoiti]|uniref:SCY kinase (Incomplete catalytic triad) n=1 Tax=Besnoitia besnoiti TaxID=94643 RepID=A0A2A9MCI2_BESBE|nr:SCY kinase (incomplete catalytic triad) [Besnoitia besnoiti]PFH36198.1 SCY kinase (incomplete catalytic triad) [Besnoitia besnoiti]
MLQSLLGRFGGKWGDLPSSFGFVVGEQVPLPFSLSCGFELFTCSRKSDGAPASLFILQKKSQGTRADAAGVDAGASLAAAVIDVSAGRSHLQRAKTLLHPDVLKTLETHESDSALYVVTEKCWPLPYLLHEQQQQQQRAEGRSSTPGALLHSQASSSEARADGFPEGKKGEEDAKKNAETEREAAAAAALADVVWGVYQITSAVAFLHESCGLLHGLINPLSVFVTANGSWRLACMEFVRQASAAPSALLADARRSAAALQGWQPPESVPAGSPPQWLDWWGLASLVTWTYASLLAPGGGSGGGLRYGGSAFGSLFDLSAATVPGRAALPPPARQLCERLLRRPSAGLASSGRVLSDCLKTDPFFNSSSTCSCLLFLREVHVKGAYEKESFFEQELPRMLQGSGAPLLPQAVQEQQVLPELLKLLDPSGGRPGDGAAPGAGASAAGPLTPAVVGCVGLVAASIANAEEGRGSAWWARGGGDEGKTGKHLQVQRLRNVLEKLFQSSDRAIRYTLLTSLPALDPLMPPRLYLRIFESLMLGLLDSALAIREATIKSLVLVCGKIGNEKKTLQTCLEQLLRLMSDAEGIVRINSCICAAKICTLPQTESLFTKKNAAPHATLQLLQQILLAGLKDGMPACRQAALQSIRHCLDLFPLRVLAHPLLAGVGVAAVDQDDASVSETAMDTLKQVISTLEKKLTERNAALLSADGNGEKTEPAVPVSNGDSDGGWLGSVARSMRASIAGVRRAGDEDSSHLEFRAGSSASLFVSPGGAQPSPPCPSPPRPPPPQASWAPVNGVSASAPAAGPPRRETPGSRSSRLTNSLEDGKVFYDAADSVNAWVEDDEEISVDSWDVMTAADASLSARQTEPCSLSSVSSVSSLRTPGRAAPPPASAAASFASSSLASAASPAVSPAFLPSAGMTLTRTISPSAAAHAFGAARGARVPPSRAEPLPPSSLRSAPTAKPALGDDFFDEIERQLLSETD